MKKLLLLKLDQKAKVEVLQQKKPQDQNLKVERGLRYLLMRGETVFIRQSKKLPEIFKSFDIRERLQLLHCLDLMSLKTKLQGI